MLDLLIIGSGPAGLAAAIYASRAELKFEVIEKAPVSGGQIINTSEVDNYPGLFHINGFDLGMRLREHAENLGAEFLEGEVTDFKRDPEKVTVTLSDNTVITARTAIIATGAVHRHLGVPGEEKFLGSGVSYCATCDGAFFKNKIVVVAGGGDVALEDALFLSKICKKVYLVHRRDAYRAAKTLVTAVKNKENIEEKLNSNIVSIDGDLSVKSVTIEEKITGNKETIPADGVFIAVGMIPVTDLFKDAVSCDAAGYIVADEDGHTSEMNVFAAGDVRTKTLRQVITAAADGACAVTSAERYLANI